MKRYLFVFVVLLSVPSFAQDVHYSQFFNSPLTLNPALTGLAREGNIRVGATYRNQWFTENAAQFFNSPYQTPTVFVDAPISLKNKDVIGVGGLFLYDRAGAGSLGTFQGIVSASYVKAIGREGNHQISVGVQAGYTQLRLQQDDLRFYNQYDNNNQYNPAIPSFVGLVPNVGYANVSVGLLYCGKFSDYVSMYVGGAFYNAATMRYNLKTNTDRRNLYYRYNGQLGLDISFGKVGRKGKYHILPSVLYMQQQTANQLNAGLGWGVDFSEDMKLTLGLYTRANIANALNRQAESVIPYIDVEIKRFKLALTYDVVLSKFQQANKGTGALEVSVIYLIERKILMDGGRYILNPRF